MILRKHQNIETYLQKVADGLLQWKWQVEENERLRAALYDMIELTKRNSSPEIIFTAIRTCATHALKPKKR